MASWATAAAPRVEAPRVRSRPRVVRGRVRANPLRSGVTWIVVLAALLGGVVALNVAVLQLNVKLDALGRERASLRAQKAQLESQLSSAAAAPRIQALARKKLGVEVAPPDATSYVELGK
jgi:cell division protein FtsL